MGAVLMLAELATWITDAGSLAAAIAAVAVVLGLLTRARPIRWVWRQLIGAPITRWMGGIVAGQVDPVRADIAQLRTDLGTNTVDLKDLRTELVTHMGAEESLRADDLAERERRQVVLDAKLDAGNERFGTLEEGQAEIKGAVDAVLELLPDAIAGNPEIHRDASRR